MTRKSIVVGIVAGLSAASGMAADNSSEPSDTLTTIIVTAQKRNEDIDKVSEFVTAIGRDELVDRNITSFREVVFLDPSLNFTQTNGAEEAYAIRGIGTFDATSFGLQESVASVYDGVPVFKQNVMRQDFSDIARVEILEGPQGLLFGTNASAGLVQVITQKPKLGEFGQEAHISYGHASVYNTEVAEGAVNIPVGETMAIRANIFYNDQSGDVLNVFNGAHLNGTHDIGGKFKFLWNPSDRLSIYLTTDLATQHRPTEVTVPYVAQPGTLLTYYQSYGITPGLSNRETVLDGPILGKNVLGGAMLEADYRFDSATLTSISGYRYWSTDENLDTDGTGKPLFNINTGHDHNRQYSEELRLTSQGPRFFDYVVGLYWNKVQDRPTDRVNIFSLFDFTIVAPNDLNAYAAFGQGTLHLSPNWRLILGARETYDHNVLNYSLPSVGVLPSSVAGFPSISLVSTENHPDLMYKVGTEYDIGPKTMAYATFTKGYKSPGFNTQALQPNQDPAVGAETPYAYEIGLKTTAVPRTRLNFAVFDTEFEHYQASVNVLVNPVIGYQSIIENAGKLSTRGFEFQFASNPITYFNVAGGLTHQVAKYVDLPNQSCYVLQTVGCVNGNADASGHDLSNAPRWIGTFETNYTRPIAAGVDGLISANYYWRSKTNFSPLGDPREEIFSYGLLGASVGVRAPSGKWAVTLWGKNLLNKAFVTSINGIGNLLDPTALQMYRSPESYRAGGISLDVSF